MLFCDVSVILLAPDITRSSAQRGCKVFIPGGFSGSAGSSPEQAGVDSELTLLGAGAQAAELAQGPSQPESSCKPHKEVVR